MAPPDAAPDREKVKRMIAMPAAAPRSSARAGAIVLAACAFAAAGGEGS